MVKILRLVVVLGLSLALAGCAATAESPKERNITQDDKRITEDYEAVTDDVEDITYKKVYSWWENTQDIYIHTETGTIVKPRKNVWFMKSDDKKTTVNYKRGESGQIYEVTVYLGTGDIKKYSKSYAEVLEETLPIREN